MPTNKRVFPAFIKFYSRIVGRDTKHDGAAADKASIPQRVALSNLAQHIRLSFTTILSSSSRASAEVITAVAPLLTEWRATYGMRWIEGNDLTGDEPVKEHPQTGEMLLDRRC